MSSRRDRKLLHTGKVLGHFRILELVGQGGYGDIYKSEDLRTHQICAAKVEQVALKKQALRRELDIIKQLDSPYFPKFMFYDEDERYRYLVMELCGPSLSTIRRVIPSHRFSISTILRAGIEMLRGIEAFHARGILHRDIKPSNFLIRASRRYPLALIDYGLSRVYINPETGELEPPRHNPGFVGTGKYASLNAHNGRELGRRDDLISWFYSLLEMWLGHLPWATGRDKQKVWEIKSRTDLKELMRGMPSYFPKVYSLIRRLGRDDVPNYKLITSLLVAAMEECGASWHDPWDWDRLDLDEVSGIDLTPPPGEEPIVPRDLPPPEVPRHEFVARDPASRGSRRQETFDLYHRIHKRRI